jgi:hypothetical protein
MVAGSISGRWMVPRRNGIVARLRGGRGLARRSAPGQLMLLAMLTVVVGLYTVGAVRQPTWFPLATAALWLMLGGFFLRMRYLLMYFAVVALAVVTSISLRHAGTSLSPGIVVFLILTALLVFGYARSREQIGIQGSLGESMLVDLRDRLLAQGEVPPLDPGWRVESVLRAAYGDSFSGDFLVAARSAGSAGAALLELALVDVSGKGQPAGTRALMLSGAFGGLLGAMPSAQFLPAANRYLLRQQWEEGFATAIHLAVDQRTGRYQMRAAGHPPAAHYHCGAGAWEVIAGGRGPLMGVLDGPDFPVHTGRILPGDALLLYTDGLVETRERDIDLGIDRLIGAAERVATHGFSGGASRILDGARSSEGDDRALVLIWRSWPTP